MRFSGSGRMVTRGKGREGDWWPVAESWGSPLILAFSLKGEGTWQPCTNPHLATVNFG